mgnify:CR=1 FL=1
MSVDTSRFPAHVRDAIKAIDLPADALKRAQAGRDWLDKNGPLDWRLQMISISNGTIRSNVVTARNDENALALALRRMDTYKGSDGRVTWATLMAAPAIMSLHDAERRGFQEKSHVAPVNVRIDEYTDSLFLDDAWAMVLGDYHVRFGQPVDAYPAELEAVLVAHPAHHHRMVA